MVPITIVNGVYKPSYNWGAHLVGVMTDGPVANRGILCAESCDWCIPVSRSVCMHKPYRRHWPHISMDKMWDPKMSSLLTKTWLKMINHWIFRIFLKDLLGQHHLTGNRDSVTDIRWHPLTSAAPVLLRPWNAHFGCCHCLQLGGWCSTLLWNHVAPLFDCFN